MWKLGLRQRNSFSVNTPMGFSLQCDGYADPRGDSGKEVVMGLAMVMI
jgi:hypothetical protein